MQRQRLPGQRLAELRLGRVGVLAQVGVERHQEARGAEPALQRVVLVEGRLQRAGLEALDRAHVAPVGLDGERQAGAHRLAVELHRARAADAVLAADLRAGEALVADEVRQQRARLDLGLVLGAVDAHGDAHAGRGVWPRRSSRPASTSARRVTSATSALRCAPSTASAASAAASRAEAPSSSACSARCDATGPEQRDARVARSEHDRRTRVGEHAARAGVLGVRGPRAGRQRRQLDRDQQLARQHKRGQSPLMSA